MKIGCHLYSLDTIQEESSGAGYIMFNEGHPLYGTTLDEFKLMKLPYNFFVAEELSAVHVRSGLGDEKSIGMWVVCFDSSIPAKSVADWQVKTIEDAKVLATKLRGIVGK